VRPEPTATGLAVTRSNAEVVERRAQTPTMAAIASHDPTFVEVDVVGRDAVHAALGVGEPREDRERGIPDRRGQVRRSEQRPDPGPRPVRVAVAGALHVDLERAQARRVTALVRTTTSPGTTAATADRTASREAPASSRAPSSMSPAMPAEASTHSRAAPAVMPARYDARGKVGPVGTGGSRGAAGGEA
jgi:hypothetical protein